MPGLAAWRPGRETRASMLLRWAELGRGGAPPGDPTAGRLGADRNWHGLIRSPGFAYQSRVKRLVTPILQVAERRKFVTRLPILVNQLVHSRAHESPSSSDDHRPRRFPFAFLG